MEDNRTPGELIDGLDDLLVAMALRRAMRKRIAALVVLLQKEPGWQGFSDGMTACGRRRVKTCVLLFCAVMTGAFFGFNHVWGGVAVAAGLLTAAVLLGASAAALRRSARFVLYNGREVRLVGKSETAVPYKDIDEVHIREDQLALCMEEQNIVLTAGAAENLQEMQAFMEHLTKAMPGRVYYDGPVENDD